MKETTTKKIIAAGSAVIFALTLSACSHQNPLQNKDKSKKEIANVLLYAARHVEAKLKYTKSASQIG